MARTTLAPGIIDFEQSDLLTDLEIHDYGMYATRTEMRGLYKIVAVALGNTCPSILAIKDDRRYVILVKTDLLPRTGRLDSEAKCQLLRVARIESATALFAGVGLGSMDLERRAAGIAHRQDAYFIKTLPFEIVEPLREPTAAPGSPRYRAECCEILGDAYHEDDYESFLQLVAPDCRIFSQWWPMVFIGYDEIKDHYDHRARCGKFNRYRDTEYRIVTLRGLRKHPNVEPSKFILWPQGPASHGFPCLKGDICMLKIDHEWSKPDLTTLFAFRFDACHRIRRILVTEAGFYDYDEFDPFPILEPAVH